MNKTLLIILCDFLLLSLLSLARFDDGLTEELETLSVAAPTPTSAEADLMEALQVALEEERISRTVLEGELLRAQDQALSAVESLSEQEQRLVQYQESLESAARRAQRLDEDRQRIEAEMGASKDELEALQSNLQSVSRQTELSGARLQEMQEELLRREREAALLQDKLRSVETLQDEVLKEKQEMAAQLRASEMEKRMAMEQLDVERKEKAKIQEHAQTLAVSVGSLAERSGEIQQGVLELSRRSAVMSEGLSSLAQSSSVLTQGVTTLTQHSAALSEGVLALNEKSSVLAQELKENRPLSGNLLYSAFLENGVDVDFRAGKHTVWGQRSGNRNTRTVLISDGVQFYIVFHAQETLLNVGGQTSWQSIWGDAHRGNASVPVREVRFLQADPRVALAVISREEARLLDVDIYPIARDPFRFDDVVLVGGAGGYFGESPFVVEPEASRYVRMERRRFSRLFGEFRPARGDLVFSRAGELIGIMVNKEYCYVLTDIVATDILALGDSLRAGTNQEVLNRLNSRLNTLPSRVQ
jgi:predicted nuclease with TOPRIM domain